MNKKLELEAEKLRQEQYTDGSITTWTKNDWQSCWKEGFIAGATSKYVEKQKEKLIKERDMYRQAYEELSCYFDSISDEEQPKIAKRIKRGSVSCKRRRLGISLSTQYKM